MIIIKRPKKTAQTYENKSVRFFLQVSVLKDFTPLWIKNLSCTICTATL